MTEEYVAFLDESGDPNFNDKASKTFFVAAVIFPRNKLADISNKISSIISQHGLSKLKSNEIGSFKRRLAVCSSLSSLHFKIATIQVNKSELEQNLNKWFLQRRSLYKYVQSILNHEISRIYGPQEITFDQYGTPQYQKSFYDYMKRKIERDLFETDVYIDSAKDNDFIQVGDFIAGSIRKAMEGDFDITQREELLALFRDQWTVNIVFPDYGKYIKPVATENNNIFSICAEEVTRYLEKNKSTINDPKILTLEYLYFNSLDEKSDWVYTNEILEWLANMEIKITQEEFRNNITAALRDEGLIIVSSRKGLKIPKTLEDFKDYVAFSTNFALPILKRLRKALVFVTEKTSSDLKNELLSEEMREIIERVRA